MNLTPAQIVALRYIKTYGLRAGCSAGSAKFRKPTAKALQDLGLISIRLVPQFHEVRKSYGYKRIPYTEYFCTLTEAGQKIVDTLPKL